MEGHLKRIQHLEVKRRNRAVMLRRFCSNASRRPWLLVCALLLLSILGWVMMGVSIPFPGGSSNPLLIALWRASVKLAVILLAVLLTLGVFTAPPRKALEYEAGLAHIGFTDRYGNPPALISRVCTDKIERLTFYSAGISLELWKGRQADIQDSLNFIYVEPPQYAYRKRYYILLTVTSGTGVPRNETLYDDEL